MCAAFGLLTAAAEPLAWALSFFNWPGLIIFSLWSLGAAWGSSVSAEHIFAMTGTAQATLSLARLETEGAKTSMSFGYRSISSLSFRISCGIRLHPHVCKFKWSKVYWRAMSMAKASYWGPVCESKWTGTVRGTIPTPPIAKCACLTHVFS